MFLNINKIQRKGKQKFLELEQKYFAIVYDYSISYYIWNFIKIRQGFPDYC